MWGGIIKALLDWITGLFRSELDKKVVAEDAHEIPSHIRERLQSDIRKRVQKRQSRLR
tara:strand:- start:4117 stop:4290 length:174 start_codon:yes stop_codon:yes gene_type:complete